MDSVLMKRVFVHIGRSKTGSTAIQRALSSNRETLARLGYIYPGSGLDHEVVFHTLALAHGHRPVPEILNFAEEASSIHAVIRSSEQDAIISTEGLMNLSPAVVRGWLDGLDVRIIVYVRDQAESFASGYQQDVKASLESAPFDEYARRHGMHYVDFLDAWAAVFGQSNMSVRAYDRRDLIGGDLVTDFLSIIGIDDVGPFKVAGLDPNPSIAGPLLEAKRRLNAMYRGSEHELREATYEALLDLANEREEYRGRVAASPSLIEAVRKRHRGPNSEMARKYLGRDFGFWERPWPEVPTFSEMDVEEALRALLRRSSLALTESLGTDAHRTLGDDAGESRASVRLPDIGNSDEGSSRAKAEGGSLATGLPSLDELGIRIEVAEGIRAGRNVREGYQRGWGLQYGGLAEKITAEPLYRFALRGASVFRSTVSDPNKMNLYLLMTRFLRNLESSDIVEFGAYKGGNALFMALVMREVSPSAKVYALDTYAGMPETDKSRDAHSAGDFADTSLSALNARISELGLTNLIPVQGLIEETFPLLWGPFGLAHIDCDMYSAVRYAQNAVWPRMCEGGYVVYDDATVSSCIGATEAVEEMVITRRVHSEQVWPHWVFRVF
jgi:hypothetical protein